MWIQIASVLLITHICPHEKTDLRIRSHFFSFCGRGRGLGPCGGVGCSRQALP